MAFASAVAPLIPEEVNQAGKKLPEGRNLRLNQAWHNRKDEFYTQYEDIARELAFYTNFLQGKTLYCNCDDPLTSAFVRYFVQNFRTLKLRKLLATCYAGPAAQVRPCLAEVTSSGTQGLANPDSLREVLSLPGNSIRPLQGNGDFRSAECLRLLEECDVVITNPPFSLFREFVSVLERWHKKFLILGNMNASTCREIFPLFQHDRLWYGETIHSGDRKFYVPEDYPLEASTCGVDATGRRFIRVKGVRWFTNIDNGRHHQPLQLTQTYQPELYPRYDNYDAIEVSRTAAIPADYAGIMGVPITFLDKYCPEQFDILMLANGNARTNVSAAVLQQAGYRPHPEDKGGVGIINGRRVYARILIRRRMQSGLR